MKKRILAIALVTMMGMSLTTHAAEDKTVILYAYPHGLSIEKFQTEYLDVYNAMQDEVEVRMVAEHLTENDAYYENLAINMSGTTDVYDIYHMSPTYFNKYVDSGMAAPLNDLMGEENIALMKEDIVEGYSRNGQLYAYPMKNDVTALFVNVDMLEGSGHTLEDLATWEGMLEAAADISETYGVYGCLYPQPFGGGYPEFVWYGTMWSAGADLYQDGEGNVTLTNKEAFAEAAKAVRDLVMGEGGTNELSNDPAYFTAGNCGMVVYQQNVLYLCEKDPNNPDDESYVDFNWAVVPIPAVGDQAYGTIGGWFSCLNANSPNLEASVEFMNWLHFETDYVFERAKESYGMVAYKGADGEMREALKDTSYSKLFDQVDNGTLKTRPELGFTSDVLAALGECINSVIYETSTDEEVMAKVDDFIAKVGATVE